LISPVDSLVWDGRGGRVDNKPVANVLPSALRQSRVNGLRRNLKTVKHISISTVSLSYDEPISKDRKEETDVKEAACRV
jgi:hypothetical protein